MAFRPYTTQEVRDAAVAYGIDPDFAEAVYAIESSRGTNPKAMTARPVKRKRDSTIVRGPFQLEDDTTSDLIKKHALGNVDVNDPDTHLDLAMRLMRDLKDQYGGDYNRVAEAYLGPGGADELGSTPGSYRNKVIAEMDRLKGARGEEPTLPESTRRALDMAALPAPAEDDVFGMGDLPVAPDPNRVSWADLVAASHPQSTEFTLPPGVQDYAPNATEEDLMAYLRQATDEAFRGRGLNG